MDELAAAFQIAYEGLEAERPPAPEVEDQVGAWVRSARDSYPHGTPEWWALDRLLDDHHACTTEQEG